MKTNIIILLITISNAISAQTNNDVYYYYKDVKHYYKLSADRLLLKLKNENNIYDQLNSISKLIKTDIKNLTQLYNSNLILIERPDNLNNSRIENWIDDLRKQDFVEFVNQCFKSNDNKDMAYNDEFIVRLKPTILYSDFESLLEDEKCKIVRIFDLKKQIYIVATSAFNNYNGLDEANKFYESGLFTYSEPNLFLLDGISDPNDPLYNLQWGHINTGSPEQYNGTPGADINVPETWLSTTGTGIKIAIIDQGVELSHPDLEANLLQGYDCISMTSNPGDGAPLSPNNAHGTNCAGIISAIADNGIGVAGVAPNSKIIPINAASANGMLTSYANIATGFTYAWQHGADVISNSYNGGTGSGVLDDAIDDAITLGRDGKGCIVVFSTGNYYPSENTDVEYPATNENVIAVGGINMCNQRKSFTTCDGETNWGARYGVGIDLVAPCVKIPSTDNTGSGGYNMQSGTAGDYFTTFAGTSSACPHVSGVAALLLEDNQTLTSIQIREILEKTCTKIPGYNFYNNPDQTNGSWNNELGYGRIDAEKAVLCPTLSDLTIINPQVSPSSVSAGNNVTASFAEDNMGYATSNPNYVKFYLSSDDVLTIDNNGDLYLGQYFINQSLAPNSQTILLSKILTIPSSVATGTYFLFFAADGSYLVDECVEDNNFATAMLNVTGVAQLADLIIQNPSVLPTSILPGESGTVYCKNKNQGAIAAIASYTDIWLSHDQVFNGAPTDINLNADIAIPALDPGQTSSLLSEQITIPPGTDCGPWYIMFRADALNAVPEGANEANNQDFISLNIPCPLLCDNDFACGPPTPPTLSISTSCNNTTCSTVGATPPSPEITYVSCAGIPYQSGRYDDDVWFKIIPANSNQISITVNPITNLANFDPVVGLYIYNGSCPSLIQVGCADENGNELPETLVHTPTAGTTYLIRVFSYGMAPTNSGDFQICVQEALPQSGLFWVGNSGNWNDGSHWSTSSGGTPCDCIPTQNDNVNFDANSFNGGGQSVNITQLAYCKSIDWTGAISSSTLSGSSALNIYGSLILNSSMNITYSGQITFKSNNPGNLIQTFGKTISSTINFDALGGEWTLQDNLTLGGTREIYLINGSLNTNGKTVSAYRFESQGSGIRLLTLGTSIINLSHNYNGNYTWYFGGSNFTLSSGASTINLTAAFGYFNSSIIGNYYDINFLGTTGALSCGNSSTFHNVYFTGGGSLNGTATYNNVSFLNDASLNSTSTFNNLTLTAGKTYTFASNTIFTISGILSADGTCATPTQIFSSSQGTAATFSKSSGAVTISYVRLKNITATGGATFTANNCTNFGNNNGWTINIPSSQNLYWIGNGGNWTDANHWSFTSGGPSSGCIPTPYNSVFFDANSFNGGGQSVIIDQIAYCKSMDWTGALSASALSGSSALEIYGSLILNSSMNITYSGQITFKSNNPGNLIQTFGKTISSTINFDALGGEWTLQDNLALGGTREIYLINGSLNTNGKTVSAYRFESQGSGIRLLTLGTSIINLSHNYNGNYTWYLGGSNFTLSSDGSTINLTAAFGYFNSSIIGNYYDINFLGTTGALSCGNSSTFHNVYFAGGGSLNGTATYNNVSFLNDASLNSTSTFNNLTLTAGKTYTFASNTIFTISGILSADGTCATPTQIFSSSQGTATTFSKSSGAVTISYVRLRDISASGGATFTVDNGTDLGNNNGWIFSTFVSQDYYWIGNGGNWSDGNHWSVTSGGASSGCIPTLYDNVFFDANSFNNGGQTVTINQLAYCKSMDWTGAISSSTLSGSSALNIYGSLILNSSMNITYSGQITFKSNNPGNLIQTFGKTISSTINFDALGGEWTLQDNLALGGTREIYLINGSLNTNGKTVSAYRFESQGSGIRLLTLGTSIINLSHNYNGNYTWYLGGSNFTLSSGASTINLTAAFGYFNSSIIGNYYDINFLGTTGALSCGNSSTFHNVYFTGGGSLNGTATYNNVSFLNDASLNSTSTFNNLTLTAGKTYTFASNTIFTISGILSADGTCATPTQIFSSSQGTAATFSKSSGAVTISYVRLKNITATGGATFTANNCTNFGNNNGWTINIPSSQNLYWIGNGGNWTDANHWSFTSGGPSSGCIPTPYNSVFFDANSFSGGGQSVIIDQLAYCKSMDWTDAISASTVSGNSALDIYGSLILNSSMNITYSGQITFKSNNPGNLIQTFGKTISSTINFDALGGEWTLQDNLTLGGTREIYLINGSLNTNGKTVSAYRFESQGSGIRLLTLGTSIINLSHNYNGNYTWYLGGSNFTLSSGGSTINLTAAFGYFNSSIIGNYYDINFLGTTGALSCGNSSTFHNVYFAGGGSLNGTATYNNVSFLNDASLNSSSTFNNLTLAAGKTYTFANGTNNTFLGNLIATGSPGNFITITGSSNFTTFTKTTGNICLDYLTLQNVHAEGGAYFFAGANSNNISGNIGWSFTSCSADPPDNPANPTSNSPQCNIVTLTAPGTPPPGVVWYWQGISCGTSTNLGSGPTFQATSTGTYYLRAYKPECSCWSSGCGSVTVEVNETTDRMWTGTISTDWTNGNNWTCGTAPNPDNDVTIPAGTPFSPFLPNGIYVWCKTLTLMPGAVLTIQPNAKLNVVQ